MEKLVYLTWKRPALSLEAYRSHLLEELPRVPQLEESHDDVAIAHSGHFLSVVSEGNLRDRGALVFEGDVDDDPRLQP